jgi:hypothetical protein
MMDRFWLKWNEGIRKMSRRVAVWMMIVGLLWPVAALAGGGVEILVGLKPGAGELAWPAGITEARRIPGSSICRVWAPEDRAEAIMAALRGMAEVAFVERSQLIPLESVGEGGTGYWASWEEIVQPGVIGELGSGAGVIIAVLDSGLDMHNAALLKHCWRNPGEIPGDGIDNEGNGYVDDVYGWNFGDWSNDPQDLYGHGTGVSWLALQVATGSTLLPLKVSRGSEDTISSGYVVAGIYYAMAAGARVINMSFGTDETSLAVEAAVRDAYLSGVTLVAAAGNTGTRVIFPASMSEVAAVGSVDGWLEPAWFTPTGAGVDLTAPGAYVKTVWTGGYWVEASGTSFSAPMVSGAAACLLSMNPYLAPWTVQYLLKRGAYLPAWGEGVPAFGHGILEGPWFYSEASPWLIVPSQGTGATLSAVTADFHLPVTDTAFDVFVGVIGDGGFWYLGPDAGWHACPLPELKRFVPLPSLGISVDGTLFGPAGVLPSQDMRWLPPGQYYMGVAIADPAGRFIAPVTITPLPAS